MSKPRCKPGDLAVVISANTTANLGRIVQVLRLDDGTSDLSFPPGQVTWVVQSQKPMTWLLNNQRVRRKCGPVPDAQLQPIRGPELGQDIADLVKDWSEVLPEDKQTS